MSALEAVVYGLLAALVGGLVSVSISERKIQVENVTQERAKWRARMRQLICDLVETAKSGDTATHRRLCSELRLSVNPFHDEDRQLVSVAQRLIPQDDSLAQEELLDRSTLLLKHD